MIVTTPNGIPFQISEDDTPAPLCHCGRTSEGECSCGCGREACDDHGRFCEEHGWVAEYCAEAISIDGEEFFLCHMDAREIERSREAA